MIYAENIFIFLAAPFIVGFFLMKGESRRFIGFFLVGAITCLLSSYINSFIASLCGMTSTEAIIKITPIIEEVMKVLPLLFYIIIFIPVRETIFASSIAIGIGFATFENCCYVVTNGADDIYFVLIRGFAVGIMHILCAAVIGFTLGFGNNQKHFSWIGVFASVSICISYHAIYNLMVSGSSLWQMYGYFMPFVTAVIVIIIINLMPIIRNE